MSADMDNGVNPAPLRPTRLPSWKQVFFIPAPNTKPIECMQFYFSREYILLRTTELHLPGDPNHI